MKTLLRFCGEGAGWLWVLVVCGCFGLFCDGIRYNFLAGGALLWIARRITGSLVSVQFCWNLHLVFPCDLAVSQRGTLNKIDLQLNITSFYIFARSLLTLQVGTQNFRSCWKRSSPRVALKNPEPTYILHKRFVWKNGFALPSQSHAACGRK